MFETVDAMNKSFPKLEMSGDTHNDLGVQEQFIARGKALRNEAFACLGRAIAKRVSQGWHRLTAPSLPAHSHRA